jgi:hypothetical protein
MALRGGFRIPNADTFAPDYQTAQPDQGDFLILGNSQYGVVSGCQVQIVDNRASVTGSGPHIVVVGGTSYTIGSSSSKGFSSANTLPRFDLVVFHTTDGFTVISGNPSNNPVFPDIDANMVVLYAIFVPSGSGNSARLIDKRNFLQTSIVGLNSSTLVKNYDETGAVKVTVDGDGKITWSNGASIEKSVTSNTITVTDNINLVNLTASGSISAGGYSVITSNNIKWSATASPPATITGNIHVDTSNGEVSVYKNSSWVSLDTRLTSGSVISSFLGPDRMDPTWLLLDGSSVTQSQAGAALWSLFYEDWKDPIGAGSPTMSLPNMAGRLPIGIGSTGSPNSPTGTVVDAAGTMRHKIALDEMPIHSHEVGPRKTGLDGKHTHKGTTANPFPDKHDHGRILEDTVGHDHPARDLGHRHDWTDGWPFVATYLGIGADISQDRIFNDRDHHYPGKLSQSSDNAYANIVVDTGGKHKHTISPDGTHTHTYTTEFSTPDTHDHSLPVHSEAGGLETMSIAPPALSLYFYIKK